MEGKREEDKEAGTGGVYLDPEAIWLSCSVRRLAKKNLP